MIETIALSLALLAVGLLGVFVASVFFQTASLFWKTSRRSLRTPLRLTARWARALRAR